MTTYARPSLVLSSVNSEGSQGTPAANPFKKIFKHLSESCPVDNKINQFKILNKLKSVYRICSVDDRHESSAEHSWSCLVLADFFLNKMNLKIDRLKVYELLMYHDVVEIEVGDSPLNDAAKRVNKQEKELNAAKKIRKDLPEELGDKYWGLFVEFEERKTPEAKFAKAIDHLDVMIHEMDMKADWKGWTREFLIQKKLHLFEDYPEMTKAFYELLDFFEKEGYFSQ
jgi:putative hydrolases of HD superfamily